MKQIIFCRHDQPYYEFSNFYKSPLIIDGIYWPTTEHLYQASKFDHMSDKIKIRDCKSAAKAAMVGRSIDRIRKDWDNVKYDVMKDIIRQKVKQHNRIRCLLLETGICEIIEYSKKDSLWGSGEDFTGSNWLGKIWMEIRDELRENDAICK